MDLIFIACIRNNGTPQTGLTPLLNGWRISDSYNVLNNITMVELGDSGIYNYIYKNVKDTDYSFLIDGGSSISDGESRYIHFKKIINEPIKIVKENKETISSIVYPVSCLNLIFI